jgi:predicted nucleic acid-binding protein
MSLTVVTDTSVLINFLVVDRMELLTCLPLHEFVVTEHVRGEVTQHYAEQSSRLQNAFDGGMISEIRVDDVDELELFAHLSQSGLGIGESSAGAVAIRRGFELAIDDRRAAKKINCFAEGLTVYSTADIMVLLLQQQALSISAADAIKDEWEHDHCFRLTFASFAAYQS